MLARMLKWWCLALVFVPVVFITMTRMALYLAGADFGKPEAGATAVLAMLAAVVTGIALSIYEYDR